MSKKYSTSQAAQRLGVSRQTVVNWIDAGILEANKLSPLRGSNYQITEEAIRKFEQQRQVQTNQS